MHYLSFHKMRERKNISHEQPSGLIIFLIISYHVKKQEHLGLHTYMWISIHRHLSRHRNVTGRQNKLNEAGSCFLLLSMRTGWGKWPVSCWSLRHFSMSRMPWCDASCQKIWRRPSNWDCESNEAGWRRKSGSHPERKSLGLAWCGGSCGSSLLRETSRIKRWEMSGSLEALLRKKCRWHPDKEAPFCFHVGQRMPQTQRKNRKAK